MSTPPRQEVPRRRTVRPRNARHEWQASRHGDNACAPTVRNCREVDGRRPGLSFRAVRPGACYGGLRVLQTQRLQSFLDRWQRYMEACLKGAMESCFYAAAFRMRSRGERVVSAYTVYCREGGVVPAR